MRSSQFQMLAVFVLTEQILIEREILKLKAIREGVPEEKVTQLFQLSCSRSDIS